MIRKNDEEVDDMVYDGDDIAANDDDSARGRRLLREEWIYVWCFVYLSSIVRRSCEVHYPMNSTLPSLQGRLLPQFGTSSIRHKIVLDANPIVYRKSRRAEVATVFEWTSMDMCVSRLF